MHFGACSKLLYRQCVRVFDYIEPHCVFSKLKWHVIYVSKVTTDFTDICEVWLYPYNINRQHTIFFDLLETNDVNVKKKINELIKWENFCRFSRYCWLSWKDKMLQILIKMKESMPENLFSLFSMYLLLFIWSIKHW